MAVIVEVIDIAPATDIYGELDSASVGTGSFPLNDLDSVDMTFSLNDPNAVLLLGPHPTQIGARIFVEREVRISRPGQRIIEGPARHFKITPDGLVTCKVYSFAWWLFRRFNGRADRIDLLVNGGFDDPTDMLGWTDGAGVTSVTDTGDVYTGTKSAIVTSSASTGISQIFGFENTYPGGIEPRFRVAFKLATGDDPPVADIYAVIGASDMPGPTVIDYEDTTVPRDVWVSKEFGLGRPLAPGVSHSVEITLMGAPDGLRWDSVFCGQPESVGAEPEGSDPADVGVLLVDRMQDPDFGKDDVGITGVSHATGEVFRGAWQDADHEAFMRMLQQLVESGTCDWWCDYENREMHFGARGTTKAEWFLDAALNFSIRDITIDGLDTANSSVVIGIGDDFTRDEGGAIVDVPGPILERVDQAEVSKHVAEYDTTAQQLATQSSLPIEAITGVVTPPSGSVTWTLDQWGGIEPGDRVPVGLAIGEYFVGGDCRILELAPDFATDTIQVTVSAVAA